MRNIPRSANVVVGDTVVTSQVTSLFPANLLVGTVAEIVPDNTSQLLQSEAPAGDQFFQYRISLMCLTTFNPMNRDGWKTRPAKKSNE